jgi:hypothetical protein
MSETTYERMRKSMGTVQSMSWATDLALRFLCVELDRLREKLRAKPEPGPNRFDCPACGQGVAADEDGCCATCGRDCDAYQDGKRVVVAERDEDEEPGPDAGAHRVCGVARARGEDGEVGKVRVPVRSLEVLRAHLEAMGRPENRQARMVWQEAQRLVEDLISFYDVQRKERSGFAQGCQHLLKMRDSDECASCGVTPPSPPPAEEFRAGPKCGFCKGKGTAVVVDAIRADGRLENPRPAPCIVCNGSGDEENPAPKPAKEKPDA